MTPSDEHVDLFQATRLAYWKAIDADTGEGGMTIAQHEREAIRQALAAVFELAVRDLGLAGPCSAALPHFLDKEIGEFCELRHGHSGDHESGPTRWRERS